MSFTPLLTQLVQSLRCLPGVGPKSAQRMALHLLERDRNNALRLAEALKQAVEQIQECQCCQMLSESPVCTICADDKRDVSMICVIESPIDLLAIEQSGAYKGYYFILRGHLSPIDGVGPEALGIHKLIKRIENEAIEEVILATNPTVEGEATAHYIASQLRDHTAKLSRIAHGVPVGGELEFVDGGTLAHALSGRRSIMKVFT